MELQGSTWEREKEPMPFSFVAVGNVSPEKEEWREEGKEFLSQAFFSSICPPFSKLSRSIAPCSKCQEVSKFEQAIDEINKSNWAYVVLTYRRLLSATLEGNMNGRRRFSGMVAWVLTDLEFGCRSLLDKFWRTLNFLANPTLGGRQCLRGWRSIWWGSRILHLGLLRFRKKFIIFCLILP